MVTALATLLILSATGPVEPGPWAAPWDGETFRSYQDPAAGISFDLPLSGFLLEARHFDARLPTEKVKHLFTLSGPDGPEVTIDVWVDARSTGVWAFFERYLSFMRDEETSIASVVVSARHVPGVMLSQPRSGQSWGRQTAVFAFGNRVFRVTCLDKDNARARKVFDRLVEHFEPEVKQ